jgi:hypothetical protein
LTGTVNPIPTAAAWNAEKPTPPLATRVGNATSSIEEVTGRALAVRPLHL